MRFAIVTETYPPEVNGVALTVQGLETGLRQRGRAVSLVRPRQAIESEAADDTLLVRGARLPRYPGLDLPFAAVLETLLRMGLGRFVRVKNEPNKEAMLNEPDAVRGIAGISIVSGVEDFIVVPFEAQAEVA